MPRGSRHELVGVLLQDGAEVLLSVPGGGAWRLDLGPWNACRARRMIGQRVRVTGVRDGFDLLAVARLGRVG